MRVERITNYVELPAQYAGGGCRGQGKPTLLLSRDEPGSADTGKRCPHGYVALSLEGADEGVFMVSQLRRALDEYERVEQGR